MTEAAAPSNANGEEDNGEAQNSEPKVFARPGAQIFKVKKFRGGLQRDDVGVWWSVVVLSCSGQSSEVRSNGKARPELDRRVNGEHTHRLIVTLCNTTFDYMHPSERGPRLKFIYTQEFPLQDNKTETCSVRIPTRRQTAHLTSVEVVNRISVLVEDTERWRLVVILVCVPLEESVDLSII